MWAKRWLSQKGRHEFVSIYLWIYWKVNICSIHFWWWFMQGPQKLTWWTRLRIAPRRRLKATRSLNSAADTVFVCALLPLCTLLWSFVCFFTRKINEKIRLPICITSGELVSLSHRLGTKRNNNAYRAILAPPPHVFSLVAQDQPAWTKKSNKRDDVQILRWWISRTNEIKCLLICCN